MSTWLIFPNQLFKQFLTLSKNTKLLLVEEPLFFKDPQRSTTFFKVKLAYTKACLLAFAVELREAGFQAVEVIPFKELMGGDLATSLRQREVERVNVYDPTDDLLTSRLNAISMTVHPTPAFLYSQTELEDYLVAMRGKNAFHQTSFYRHFRLLRGWLVTKGGGFEGGQLTFDQDNRKPMPASIEPPLPFEGKPLHAHWREACDWVEQEFPEHPGTLEKIRCLSWPVTREEAKAVWQRFLEQRFARFGPYQDAIREWRGADGHAFLFHSTISAALNTGLLDPHDLVTECLAQPGIPLASREGFLRQVVGWREFIRLVYLQRGEEMRQANQLSAHRALSGAWYGHGSLGIPPLDDAVQMALSLGYLHHIIRLMVVANWMTLAGIDPQAMYRWFLDFSMDSYDWVMVPNVMGMASYATPLLSTKPYISGSAYLLRMSNFTKGPWSEDWDALYYDFLHRNEQLLAKNPRCGLMYANLRKKKPADLEALLGRAKKVLVNMDSGETPTNKRFKSK